MLGAAADFAPTSVLERRAHVPNDVVGMGIGNGFNLELFINIGRIIVNLAKRLV